MPLSAHVPDLSALEMLLTVARTGSLNSASRELGVSQQAASARVRAIEAQTGISLLSRSARGSTLAAEGVVIAEWGTRLLAVAAELDAGIAALRQDHRRRLRVSASLTVAERLLPAWLVSFRAGARDPGQSAAGGAGAEIVLTAGAWPSATTLPPAAWSRSTCRAWTCGGPAGRLARRGGAARRPSPRPDQPHPRPPRGLAPPPADRATPGTSRPGRGWPGQRRRRSSR